MIGFVGAFLPIFNIKLLWSEFCYVSLLLFTVVFIDKGDFGFVLSFNLIYRHRIIYAVVDGYMGGKSQWSFNGHFLYDLSDNLNLFIQRHCILIYIRQYIGI